jgi:hypothetical protein
MNLRLCLPLTSLISIYVYRITEHDDSSQGNCHVEKNISIYMATVKNVAIIMAKNIGYSCSHIYIPNVSTRYAISVESIADS